MGIGPHPLGPPKLSPAGGLRGGKGGGVAEPFVLVGEIERGFHHHIGVVVLEVWVVREPEAKRL